MDSIILETERLLLQSVHSDFTPLILRFLVKNEEHLRVWSPIREENFYTIDFQNEAIQKKIKAMEEGRELRFYLFAKNNTQSIVGDIGYSNIIRGAFLSCYLGYKIDKDEAGKGLITEALQAANNYIFKYIGLHRIEANVLPYNIASIRVLEKLGFEKEGYARKYLNINGIWQDHIHYVLFNEEMEKNT